MPRLTRPFPLQLLLLISTLVPLVASDGAGDGVCEKDSGVGCIDEDYAERLRWMLRYTQLPSNSATSKILKNRGHFLGAQSGAATLSWEEIIHKVEENAELFLESAIRSQQIHGRDVATTSDSSYDYDRCKDDYDAIVLPWTNRLSRIVLLIVNQTVCLEECEKQDCPRTCAGTCDELCSHDPDILEDLFPVQNRTTRTRRAMDATAKIPAAIADGNVYWVGAYHMCNEIDATPEVDTSKGDSNLVEESEYFQGQYCRMPLIPKNNPNSPLIIYYGACVPKVCTEDDLYEYVMNTNGTGNSFIQLFLENILGATVLKERIFCGFTFGKISDEAGLPALYAIMSIILALMVTSTIYDMNIRRHVISKIYPIGQVQSTAEPVIKLYTQQSVDSDISASAAPNKDLKRFPSTDSKTNLVSDQFNRSTSYNLQDSSVAASEGGVTFKQRLEVAFLAFSAYSNIRRIWRIRHKPGHLAALDGIRVLSFGYFLLGCTWVYGPVYSDFWITANIVRPLTTLPRQFMFQAIIAYHFNMDSFLLVSGLLVTYHWLRKYCDQSETWRSYLSFYLRRYWKYIPSLMLSILFVNATYKMFTGGPLSADQIPDVDNCLSNWWTNLLLVTNLVNTDEQCFSTVSYIYVLYQLYIATVFILLPLTRWRIVSYVTIAIFYVIHVGATAGIISALADGKEGNWMIDYLYAPWCRAGPYLLGLALGIFLHDIKCELKLNKFVRLAGWIVALLCITAPSYGTYGVLKEGGELWTKGARVMYETFGRMSWAVGVAWIVVVSVTGNGGIAETTLTWPAFQPLSKLIYPTMVMSSSVIYGALYSREYVVYVNQMEMLTAFFSNIWSTYIVGFLFVGLFFYYPLSLGIIRAVRVKTFEECIMAGDHTGLESWKDESSSRFTGNNNAISGKEDKREK